MKKVFVIAEIAQAHDGSLGILHSYIDALATTGVDAVKFQTHIAEAESSEYETFRVNFSYEDRTRFDYWKRMEFTPEQWFGIKEHCEKVGVEFISSPFSIEAVNLLETLNVKRYKIGSGEVNNLLMLERISKTGKPVILSSGMSSYSELDVSVNFLKNKKNPLSILQCTTQYPTSPENIGLNVIGELRTKYNLPVGFSDHSGTIYPCLAAVSLGAEIIEFHAVFDKMMFGPDAKSSLTISEIKQLVEGTRYLEAAMNNPAEKNDNSSFAQLKIMFGKSLAINKDLVKGHIIQLDDLETKKPGNMGVPASEYQNLIGKRINKDISKYSFIHYTDIDE